MRKLLLILLCLFIVTPAFADEFLVNWDVTGSQAAINLATSTVTGATMTYSVEIPDGAEYASVFVKSGTYTLQEGDAVAGSISNVTVAVNTFNSANLPVQMEAAGLSGIPGYDQDSADETFDAMPNSNTTGIANYGIYAIPTYGFKFLNVVFTVTGSTGENAVVVDFNPPPR